MIKYLQIIGSSWFDHLSDTNWAVQQQSKARNSDSKYRQMALVGFDT